MNTLLNEPEAYTMHHRISALQDQDLRPLSDEAPPDRELTLGTTTILGIFFALALVCAAFFAFGYSLGSKHNAAIVVAPTSAASISPKPTPGSPAADARPSAAEFAPAETVTVPVAAVPVKAAAPPPAEEPPAPLAETRPSLSSIAQPIVQVAAVSHQEDAELIASTLKRHGYAVIIRSEPQDKLLHLQLGPFPTKKDAEAMREKLLSDGFNAYIK